MADVRIKSRRAFARVGSGLPRHDELGGFIDAEVSIPSELGLIFEARRSRAMPSWLRALSRRKRTFAVLQPLAVDEMTYGTFSAQWIESHRVESDELSPEQARSILRYLADAHERAVLYIDEIDGFALDRDAQQHTPTTRAVLVAFLAALDGLVETGGPLGHRLVEPAPHVPR